MIESHIQARIKILVILGPTATGKTDLALDLAKRFNGEIISADSRQVYQGLDIGTGKMPGNGQLRIDNGQLKKGKGFWEMDGTKIWMYDVVSPKVQYNVADYVKDARRVVEDVQGRGKLPIVVGGTGLYLKALLYGLANLSIPVNRKLRKKLIKLSLAELQKKLQRLSYPKWQSLNSSDRQNPRRLIRAIEIEVMKPNNRFKIYDLGFKNFDVLKIGLTAKREFLYQRVDERVASRIKQGMIEEAERLKKEGLSLKRMRQLGLEYGVLADFLASEISSKEKLIKILQGKIHDYVRRQITWFKKEENVDWFDITDRNYPAKVENLITKWYDSIG